MRPMRNIHRSRRRLDAIDHVLRGKITVEPIHETTHTSYQELRMWYFTWILGIGLADLRKSSSMLDTSAGRTAEFRE